LGFDAEAPWTAKPICAKPAPVGEHADPKWARRHGLGLGRAVDVDELRQHAYWRRYHLLAYDQGPVKLFEPFLITMDDDSQQYPTFQHPGTEFLYMLEGKLEYRCAQQTYCWSRAIAQRSRAPCRTGPIGC
jgi:hypothetical protein